MRKKGLFEELNVSPSDNGQCESVYVRATSDMAFKMMHCDEKRIHFSEHVLSAIMSSDPYNHDNPTIGRRVRFWPPFHGKLSVVETSQWKETHDDCLNEMDSCFKIEGTGQYIIMEVQRWRIPGLNHKIHSYGCEKYKNTLKNREYKNAKDVRYESLRLKTLPVTIRVKKSKSQIHQALCYSRC
jgi:hypothetical protein